MKTGIIDVGGGMRGTYAAGILDWCMDQGILFDLCIGISAGSSNMTCYVSGQRGRSIYGYLRYPQKTEYMSLRNLLTKKQYVDLDYVYGTICNEGAEIPIDYEAIMKSPMELLVSACDAETGKTKYFTKNDIHPNDFSILKASSAIPVVSKAQEIDGHYYYDGALGETIPLRKAFACGCEKVVLILSKPRETVRKPGRDIVLARMIEKKYPETARRLANRAARYNLGVARAKELEAEEKVLILAPRDLAGMDTLKTDGDGMQKLYDYGYEDAEKILGFLGLEADAEAVPEKAAEDGLQEA